MMVLTRADFPDPLSPTMPKVSPRCKVNENVVHGPERAAGGVERGRQVLDGEQGGLSHSLASCTSNLARSRSPTTLNENTVRNSAITGTKVRYGAVDRLG